MPDRARRAPRGRPRVLVAGLGDSGLLVAGHLARHADVVGVTTQPGLVSGQELGLRLADPEAWRRDYWVGLDRYRRLDRVRTVHAELTGLDAGARTVQLRTVDGVDREEQYDVLVVATGTTNGFWRRPELRTAEQVEARLRADHERLAVVARAGGRVEVVGGGASAVASAAHLARRWPDLQVGLRFPGDAALPHHHPRVWATVARRLEDLGVALHPGHRAVLPGGDGLEEWGSGPVAWSTGQEPTDAELVLWAVGRVRPSTGWLPPELLDEHGFVRVDPDLRLPGLPGHYAVGDVAATDPLRSSARNRADRLVARNVRAELAGRPLAPYRPARHRWGSVLGPQPDGLQVFTPRGAAVRVPALLERRVLRPLAVERGIYGGVRRRGTPPA